MYYSKFTHFTLHLLISIVWISAMLFGLYILAFYFIALLDGNTAQWNTVLPGLYDEHNQGATVAIGVHFAAGGLILILGCIQLLSQVRESLPVFHRWTGRVYVFACIATALGGLIFICINGTIGGLWMNAGFSGYGVFTLFTAIQTIKFARTGDFAQHRAWAIRLFALAIGSWLYRMEYGFWFLVMDRAGHTSNFTGPFDYFMDFFFYLPNLLVAELFIQKKKLQLSKPGEVITSAVLLSVCAFLILATYFFTRKYWGPAILAVVSG